jgi:hypothetical protein
MDIGDSIAGIWTRLGRATSILLTLLVMGALGAGVSPTSAQIVPTRPGPAGGSPAIGLRHEPIFGVGPHTTWRGGMGIEIEVQEVGGETVLPIELLYGVTEEVTATLVLPFSNATGGTSLDEVGLRAKWRFATRFSQGQMDALALVGGVTLPRTSLADVPVGGPIAMLGLAAGRESRRWYYFGGVRGVMRFADDGLDPGERILTNLAWGIRPQLSEYMAPDLVLLLEANGRFTGRSTSGGETVETSGGRVLSVAPGFFLSIRNVMLKGGLDIPVWTDLNDPEATADTRLIAAVEVHW